MRTITFILFFLITFLANAQYQFEQVADIWTGTNNSSPRDFVEYNGEIYFRATNQYQEELYKSNGSVGNIQMVKNINGGASSVPKPLFVFNNLLFFKATTTAEGEELKLIKLTGTEKIQGIIEVENGFIASGFQ